jgi:hypothetical protein
VVLPLAANDLPVRAVTRKPDEACVAPQVQVVQSDLTSPKSPSVRLWNTSMNARLGRRLQLFNWPSLQSAINRNEVRTRDKSVTLAGAYNHLRQQELRTEPTLEDVLDPEWLRGVPQEKG